LDKRSLWLYIARATGAGAGIVVHFFFARIGGLEGYGLLSLFLNLNLFLSYIADFGFSLNGPRLLLNDTSGQLSHTGQYVRTRLSVLTALLFVVLIYTLYPAQAEILVWGLPMILLYGLQADWIHRGSSRPDLAAYRQMAQSSGQLILVAAVWYGEGSLALALALYAAIAGITFVWSYPRWPHKPLQTQSVTKILREQGRVLLGMLLYFGSYNLVIPLLTYLEGAELTGFYASHYFLCTSLGTLSVITMEVFMAKSKEEGASYGKWMLLFTGFAVLGIGMSYWYFPFIFGDKGFYWDAWLTLIFAAICVVHALRLYWVNGLLFSLRQRQYLVYSRNAFFFHLLLIVLWLVFENRYTALAAALILLIAETLPLLVFGLKERKMYAA